MLSEVLKALEKNGTKEIQEITTLVSIIVEEKLHVMDERGMNAVFPTQVFVVLV